MLIETGIDIVQISRIEIVFSRHKEKFPKRILTKNEFIEFQKINERERVKFLAKKFCVKEAISKALGTGIPNHVLNWQSLEINKDKNGKPYLMINQEISDLVKRRFGSEKFSISISISDEKEYVIANAILSCI